MSGDEWPNVSHVPQARYNRNPLDCMYKVYTGSFSKLVTVYEMYRALNMPLLYKISASQIFVHSEIGIRC